MDTGKFENEILNTPLEDMNFGVRAYHVLKRAGLTVAGDLNNYTDKELLRLRNLGSRSLKEIIYRAMPYGIVIKKELDTSFYKELYEKYKIVDIDEGEDRIESLYLNEKSYRILKKAKIDFLMELHGMSLSELSNIKGMTKDALEEILEKSNKRGVKIVESNKSISKEQWRGLKMTRENMLMSLKSGISIWDFDGVLCTYRAEENLTHVTEKEYLRRFIGDKDIYGASWAPNTIKDIIRGLDRNNVYVLSDMAHTFELRKKTSFIKANYPSIKEDNILFARSEYKAIVIDEMYNQFLHKYVSKKSDIIMIEDSLEVIGSIEELGYTCYHISMFL